MVAAPDASALDHATALASTVLNVWLDGGNGFRNSWMIKMMNGAAMNNYARVLPLCFTMMLGLGTAHAQATPAQKVDNTYGTSALVKHGAHLPGSKSASKSRHSHRRRGSNAKLKGETFDSEMTAKAHCPTQTVVWLNTHGHVFHLPKSKYYGKTKHGAFVCEKAAETAGFNASKR